MQNCRAYVISVLADKNYKKRRAVMNKKDALSVVFFAGLLAAVIVGMVALQPDKKLVEPKMAYELKGFPALSSEIR